VTASITNEAVDDLKLTAGSAAYAVIKASDVMIGSIEGLFWPYASDSSW